MASDELRITTRLVGDEAAWLRELSQRTGQGTSALIREALRHYRPEPAPESESVPPTEIPPTPPPDEAAAEPVAPGDAGPNEPPPLAPETPPSKAPPAPVGTRTRTPSAMDYGVGVRILTAPFDPGSGLFDDEAIQRFLLNKRVRRLVPVFFTQEGRAYWSLWVEYEPLTGASSPSPSQGNREHSLDATQQRFYDRLSAWRKSKAEAGGVPVYVVATNVQLADVVRQLPRSLEALRQIKGFGKGKIDRHGRDILALVSAFIDNPASK